MSDSPLASPADDNPYRAPVSSSEAAPTTHELDPWRRLEASTLLQRIYGCYRALGAIHGFFAVISIALGGIGILAILEAPEPNPVIYVTIALLAFTITVDLTLGAGAFFFQSWAAWGTIGYRALSLALDLSFGGLGGCSTYTAAAFIALSIAILVFEKKLRAFGVSKHAALRRGMIEPSPQPAVAPNVRVSDGGSVTSSAFREISGDSVPGK